MKSFSNAILLIAVFLLLNQNNRSFSQNIPVRYNFDTTITNSTGSIVVYVKNPLSGFLRISNVRTLTSQFYVTQNNFVIGSSDSVPVTVFFRTNQNITYNDFIIFESEDLNYSIVVT